MNDFYNKMYIIALYLLLIATTKANSQELKLLKQVDMAQWQIPPANYSGITPIGDNRYALVSDKNEGYYIFDIDINKKRGKVDKVKLIKYLASPSQKPRDREGIVALRGSCLSLFISGEADQEIMEYDSLSRPTGRHLSIPKALGIDSIQANYGFEALAYSAETETFFTATEAPLKSEKEGKTLRLQCFNSSLEASEQFAYILEDSQLSNKGKIYCKGLSALTALDGKHLLSLEREVNVPQSYIGAKAIHSIFLITLDKENMLVKKKKLSQFSTGLSLGKLNFANYEGMCLGPKLEDGRQTIILINDSQAGMGNSLYHLKDYIKIGILSELPKD